MMLSPHYLRSLATIISSLFSGLARALFMSVKGA